MRGACNAQTTLRITHITKYETLEVRINLGSIEHEQGSVRL